MTPRLFVLFTGDAIEFWVPPAVKALIPHDRFCQLGIDGGGCFSHFGKLDLSTVKLVCYGPRARAEEGIEKSSGGKN